MYLADRTNLTPELPVDDPDVASHTVRAHISLKGLDDVRRFSGILAQSNTHPDDFVLALRGTRSRADYVANGMVAVTKFSDLPRGSSRVHRGWYGLFKSAKATDPSEGFTSAAEPDFVACVNSLIATYQSRARDGRPASLRAVRLTVTGHSLGAAILTLFVVKNASIGDAVRPFRVYTLASPMVGDGAFVAAFNALGLDSRRIVIEKDTVPRLPGKRLGYAHVDAEAVLKAPGVVGSPRHIHSIETYRTLLRNAPDEGSLD